MKQRLKKRFNFLLIAAIAFLIVGFFIPQKMIIPVEGASAADWNHATFWYEPWGRSGVHKGIDIFSVEGAPLVSATNGIVLYKGQLELGGNVVYILGPKWRIHYYAHLDSISTKAGSWVSVSDEIATVGTSGNAQGKPAHLHYSVVTLIPYLWRLDMSTQGWKKIFYLNPSELLLVNNS